MAQTFPVLSRLYAIPNGAYLARGAAGYFALASAGLKKGVPDMCLPVARKGYHSLYIELKTETGKLSDDQRRWLSELRGDGNYSVVCVGSESAIECLTWYLSEEKDNE